MSFYDQQLDARDLLCPLPVLRARKVLMAMQAGQVLQVLATDPAAVIDMPHFAQSAGHRYLGATPFEGATAYLIARGETPTEPAGDDVF